MNFLINSKQFNLITENISTNNLTSSCKKMKKFLDELVKEVSEKYKINLKILMTWGPSIGGFLIPLDNFIKTGEFDLTDSQVFLILAGVASTLFLDNLNLIKKIIDKIKEEGIIDTFKKVLSKAKKLSSTFVKFIKSLKTSVNTFTDIISYSFLIPIISDLKMMLSGSEDISQISALIAKRLIASGVVVAVGTTLNELIEKIMKNLRSDSTQKQS
jgi:hypothetical protein